MTMATEQCRAFLRTWDERLAPMTWRIKAQQQHRVMRCLWHEDPTVVFFLCWYILLIFVTFYYLLNGLRCYLHCETQRLPFKYYSRKSENILNNNVNLWTSWCHFRSKQPLPACSDGKRNSNVLPGKPECTRADLIICSCQSYAQKDE